MYSVNNIIYNKINVHIIFNDMPRYKTKKSMTPIQNAIILVREFERRTLKIIIPKNIIFIFLNILYKIAINLMFLFP